MRPFPKMPTREYARSWAHAARAIVLFDENPYVIDAPSALRRASYRVTYVKLAEHRWSALCASYAIDVLTALLALASLA